MRQSIMIGLAVGLMVLAVGCERKSASQETKTYDSKLDGPPSVLTFDVDPRLTADQAQIAEASKRASEKPATPATPGAETKPAETPATSPTTSPAETKPAETPTIAPETKPAEPPKEVKPAESKDAPAKETAS